MGDFFITHGTFYDHLINILKDGFIDNNPKKHTGSYAINLKQIFTQVIYKGIPYERTQRPFWFSCCIIIDPIILRDFPFYCLAGVGGADDQSFKHNINRTDSRILQKGWGKLNKITKITKIKKHINMIMNRDIKQWGEVESLCFMHTHELMFNRKISLRKYVIAIACYPSKQSVEIKKYCDKLGIKFILLPDQFYGINKFIKLIRAN